MNLSCWHVQYISICIDKCTVSWAACTLSISGTQQDILRQSDVAIKMHEAQLNPAFPFPSP